MAEAAAPLESADILAALDELADRLPSDGRQHLVVVVGGALLAWHGLRESTFDIDSVQRLDVELTEAVAQIGQERGRRTDWLNSDATAFLPQSFDLNGCSVILERQSLRVLAAPLRAVFAMKLFSGRAVDRPDLVAMWPHCGFESPEQAVAEYWAAYPSALADEHLVDWVTAIADEAES